MRHDVKLTLRQKAYVIIALFTAGILMVMLSRGGLLLLFGLALFLTGVKLDLDWYCCPSCGEFLGRIGFAKFCPHCGKEIDWDEKKS